MFRFLLLPVLVATAAMLTPTDDQRRLAGPVCDWIEENLPDDIGQCACAFDFNTFAVNYTCDFERACFFNDELCGKPEVNGILGLARPMTMESNVCLQVNTTNPTVPGEFCMDLESCTGDLLNFCGCTATAGNETCNSCQVCDSGIAFRVNCTNASPGLVTGCFGL